MAIDEADHALAVRVRNWDGVGRNVRHLTFGAVMAKRHEIVKVTNCARARWRAIHRTIPVIDRALVFLEDKDLFRRLPHLGNLGGNDGLLAAGRDVSPTAAQTSELGR